MKSLNILNRLKIRSKLIIFLIIPILTILFFSISGIYTKFQELKVTKSSHDFTTVSLHLADLVHELQKERGLSAGFVGSGGQSFRKEVLKQRKQTDEKLSLFNLNLDTNAPGEDHWGLIDEFTHLQQELNRLPVVRIAINTLKEGDFFSFYSNLNAHALNIIQYLQVLTNDASLARQGDAFTSLLRLQERAGQERGALNGIFASGKLDSKLFQEISAYVADQTAILNNYYTVASNEYQGMLQTKLKHPTVVEVEELRAAAINKARRNELLNDLQMMIGYGGLIHDFKDYVIRGRLWYLEHFSELSLAAKNIIEQYQHLPGMSPQGVSHLNSIETTFEQYQALMKDVTKMKKLGRSIVEIDKMVNIDDKSALNAIKELRKDVTSRDTSQWWEKATFRIGLIKEVSDAIRSDMVYLTQQSMATTTQSVTLYLMLSITSLTVSFFLGYVLMRRLVEELVNISTNMHSMQKHRNFDQRLVVSGSDEISDMAHAFNDLINEREISEADRKQAEKKLFENQRKLISAQHIAKIGNWEWDFITNTIVWSKEMYSIFGVDSSTYKPTPEGVSELIHLDDKSYVLNPKTFEQNNHIEKYEMEFRIIDQSTKEVKYIHLWGETNCDDKGNAIKNYSTLQDITERIRQEEQLRRSQKMDALGKLTGGIAHDYNNMLAVITGYSELLEDELSEQPILANYAHEILHAGQRGAKLTKKLLAFSRKKSAVSESLDINTLLQDERHMLEKTLTARIELVFDLYDDLWSVWVDNGDLEDAIINISINAMHAIDGSGRLTIRTHNEKIGELDAQALDLVAGDYVTLSIADTGCGMDEATQEKIFDPFYSTKGDKGTGLGLSQVYGFVERSNGAIRVHSEPGHGSQFTLYFPRLQKSSSDDNEEQNNKAVDLSGKETILIVDDEAALLNLSCEILKQKGYKVICAENAPQALKILENESIDLLLSDLIMPEMDGYQLAAIVQEKYPEVKIQLASGFANDLNVDMIDDDLHQNLIYKPYQSQTLLRRIRELLDE